jgi:predicted metal-dependent enzyme (double-stranded beta helix superfamily)
MVSAARTREPGRMAAFDVDELVAACVACRDEPDTHRAVRDVLARTVSEPAAVAERLPPERAGITLLYNTPDLTIINVVWAPKMQLFAHDHRMWAALAIYSGAEDNAFFRRDQQRGTGLLDSGGRQLGTGDVLMLGADVIHSVANPKSVPTGAIHVYGGDFVRQPRSQWRPPDYAEAEYDGEQVRAVFDDANAAWHAPAD